jgi:DNA modification methylase
MTHLKEYPSGRLLIGDVMDRIRDIPTESIDCVITSPPYWGLRDYGTGKWVGGDEKCDHSSMRRKTRAERKSNEWMDKALGEGTFGDEPKWTSNICKDCGAKYEDPQWGSEPDFREYLARMRELMNEIKRVLKNTGTAWINLGDSYGSHRSNQESIKIGYEKQEQAPQKGLEKSRVGVPERFYIQCIDDGWIARNHIIWAKSNAMPTSVKDRFQNKWESIFFFSKKKKYFFDLDPVREKPISDYQDFNRRVRDAKKYKALGLGDFSPTLAKASEKEMAETNKNGAYEIPNSEEAMRKEGRGKRHNEWRGNQQPEGRSNFGTGSDIRKNMEKAYLKNEASKYEGESNANRLGQFRNKERAQGIEFDYSKKYKSVPGEPKGNTAMKERMAASRAGGANHDACLNDPKGKNPGDIFNINPKPFVDAHFATFPIELPTKIIKCAVPPNGTVFDPFMGSGTVALAAINLARKWVGIELNPEYAEIIDKRLKPKMSATLDSFGEAM